MSHIINWIKFKVQKVLGIYELIEKVAFLEEEIVRLNIKLYAAEDGIDNNNSSIKTIFATISELERATDQTDNMYHLGSKTQQWEKEEEINFIQKSYE